MPDFNRRSFNGGDPSLPEINRTDRLLDALAGEQPVYANDSADAELAYLLAGWRDEVRQPPMHRVLTPRDAAVALDRATTSTHRRRLSLAVVGSVAAAVLCLGGFGSVIYGAGPGDALYGLRTMFFGEQQVTRDDQVALAAQTQLAEVQQLIERGDWNAAQDKLQTLTTTVAAVGDVDRQQQLVDQWQQLSVKVETRDVNATVPPDAPPVVLPSVPSDLPLPVLLSPDSPTSVTSPSTAPPASTSTETSPPGTSSPTSTPTSPSTTPAPSQTSTTAPPVSTTGPTTAPASPTSTSLPPTSAQITTSSAVAVPPTTTSAPAPVTTTVVAPTTTPAVTPTVSRPVEEPTTEVSVPPTREPQIVVTTTTVIGLPELPPVLGGGAQE
jgi:hypothetical protein